MPENRPSGVVTRFPPSPTGYLHIGRARTALFNYLFARHNGGKMLFRIEDTDKERSKREYEQNIIECLAWLRIDYNEGPIRQSERTEIYKKYLQKMLADGHAYVSKETDPEATRKEVIRFKNPNKKVVFKDLIRGEVEFDTTDLKDFVIAKSLDEPLYHVTVVVDDHEMGVTHVIRGEDGISNTPRQILIQEAIAAVRPIYAHVPLILAADRSKLSGRHGAVAVTEYRNMGYLPEAIINFLGLLGWNPGTEQELFSIEELVAQFDLSKVQKAGAVFNIEKLNWFNRQYILKMPVVEFTERAGPFFPEWLSTKSLPFQRILPTLREKINTLAEIAGLFSAGGELAFVKGQPEYPRELLLWKKTLDPVLARVHLSQCHILLTALADEQGFSAENVRSVLWSYAEANGKGDVLWPLRVALTGQEKSPNPFVAAFILGREESLARIDIALKKLT